MWAIEMWLDAIKSIDLIEFYQYITLQTDDKLIGYIYTNLYISMKIFH